MKDTIHDYLLDNPEDLYALLTVLGIKLLNSKELERIGYFNDDYEYLLLRYLYDTIEDEDILLSMEFLGLEE